MPLTDPILDKITAYLAREPRLEDGRRMTKSTFGKLAVNDSAFVFFLEDGREVRRATRLKVEQFIKDHPPPRRPRHRTAAS